MEFLLMQEKCVPEIVGQLHKIGKIGRQVFRWSRAALGFTAVDCGDNKRDKATKSKVSSGQNSSTEWYKMTFQIILCVMFICAHVSDFNVINLIITN